MRWRVNFAIVATTVMMMAAAACAARGARNQARVGALASTDIVLDLNKAEYDVYAAKIPGYGQAEHDRSSVLITKVIYAVRGYERAAKAWPKVGPVPAELDQAAVAVNLALDDFARALPAVDAVRVPIAKAIAALRAVIASGLLPVAPARSELPLPIGALFSIIALLGKLVGDGRLTLQRLLAILKQEGATDEELDAADVRLTAAAEQREREQAGR